MYNSYENFRYFHAQVTEGDKLGIFLFMENFECDDFTAKFEASVHTLENQKKNIISFLRTYNKFKGDGLDWGWPQFISIKEIFKNSNHFLKNNTLTLGMKVGLII